MTLQSSRGINLKLGLGLKASLCLAASASPSCCPTPLPISPRGQFLINHLHENPHPKAGSWGSPRREPVGMALWMGLEDQSSSLQELLSLKGQFSIRKSSEGGIRADRCHLEPAGEAVCWCTLGSPRLRLRAMPLRLPLLDQGQGSAGSSPRWGYGKGAQ